MEPIQQTLATASPAEATVPGQDGNAKLLDELNKDYKRLKAQKVRSSGGVEGRVLLNLCFLNNEMYVTYSNKTLATEPKDANKLYLSFNLISPRHTKLMGRLSAFNAPFKARPDKQDPEALEDAEIVDRMIVATDEKLDEPSRMRERLYWMTVGGVAFEYVPWIPNASMELNVQFDSDGVTPLFKNVNDPEETPIPQPAMEQLVASGQAAQEEFVPLEVVELVGDVGSDVFGPFNVMIDQTTKSVADLPPGSWVHIARIKTTGWIKDNFGIDVKKQTELSLISSKFAPDVSEASGGVYLKDLIPLIQGTAGDNDPDMVVYVESYQQASQEQPHGQFVCWIPGDQILHADQNPYEEIPLVDFHWAPVTTSFWGSDYVSPLIAPQRFINKRMSQLGEQSNNALYSPILLGGTLSSVDIPSDYPGTVKNGLDTNGVPMAQRMAPPELPMWFLPSLQLAIQTFNDLAGGMDLMEQNKFPGQLRGPMAVPMLQEIMDTQWGPLFMHLGERIARVKQMRLNRIRQFYPPVRTLHYTDKTQKDEVMEFHTEKILRSGTNYNITVERGAILPELRALREARVSERLMGPLSILYMDERTGRLDKSKIAADLQFGDTGRESRESQYRKLGVEIVGFLWKNQDVPPVMPFYDHSVMLDELESAMATTEFLKASPQIQARFIARWEQHQQFLQQEAQNQQMAIQSGMIQKAVAQATQMAAAKAAADAVTNVQDQMSFQQEDPTSLYVAQANMMNGRTPQNANRPAPQALRKAQPGPQAPGNGGGGPSPAGNG